MRFWAPQNNITCERLLSRVVLCKRKRVLVRKWWWEIFSLVCTHWASACNVCRPSASWVRLWGLVTPTLGLDLKPGVSQCLGKVIIHWTCDGHRVGHGLRVLVVFSEAAAKVLLDHGIADCVGYSDMCRKSRVKIWWLLGIDRYWFMMINTWSLLLLSFTVDEAVVQGALGAELRWPNCFSHAQPYCFIITQHPSEMQAYKRAGWCDCIYHSEPFLRHFNVWKLLTIDWSVVLWWHLADSPLVFLWSAGGLGEQPFMWQCERLQFRLLAGAQVMTEGRFWKMEKNKTNIHSIS